MAKRQVRLTLTMPGGTYVFMSEVLADDAALDHLLRDFDAAFDGEPVSAKLERRVATEIVQGPTAFDDGWIKRGDLKLPNRPPYRDEP